MPKLPTIYLILLIIISGCQPPVKKGSEFGKTCSTPPPITNRQCFTNISDQRNKNTVFILAAGADVGELTKTSSDLKKFSQTMQKYFEKNDIKIPKSQICQLPNVFKSEMENSLQSLNKHVKSNDLVIIYFSGHGTFINDDNNGDEKDNKDEVLVTYDSYCKSEPKTTDGWRDDDFVSSVNSLPTNRVLTVMDTCFSSGMILGPSYTQLITGRSKFFVKGIFGIVEYSSRLDKRNIIKTEIGNLDSLKGLLLAAAGEGQEALEIDKGGLFTTTLLEKLSQNNNLKQAFAEAATYIQEGTQNSQIPQAIGNWKIIEESSSIWDITN